MVGGDKTGFLDDRLGLIINSIEEGVIVIDRQGVVTSINKPAGTFTGIVPSQAIGSHVNKIFPEAGLLEVLPEGVGYQNREVERNNHNGAETFVVSALPIKESGEVTGVVATIRGVARPDRVRAGIASPHSTNLFDAIKGNSPQLVAAKNKALRVSGSSSSVLIRGESGTGKELFARAIHQASKRHGQNFVSINCAAIPGDLLESELFGYEPGAFTGAQKSGRAGKFEVAHRGTVFLDEVGDMTTELQVKILRVLQDGRFFRVGGLKEVAVDVRIIAATNQNLEDLIATGRFREDLFYRLNVIPLEIPPLRDRKDDILLLAEHFFGKYNDRLQKSILGVDAEARQKIVDYNWPGNVRELENVIEYAINMESSRYITLQSLPVGMVAPSTETSQSHGSLRDILEFYERRILKRHLDKWGWDTAGKLRAADALGIGKTTLYNKLKKLGMV